MKLEINTILTIGALIIYVIIFFIQKSQLDKQKSIIDSMKSFIDIFKVDEVKKYVEMRNERIMHDAKKMVMDSESVNNLRKELLDTAVTPVQEHFTEIMGERFEELNQVVFQMILNQKPELREQFIKDLLPRNKDYMIPILNDYNKNNE